MLHLSLFNLSNVLQKDFYSSHVCHRNRHDLLLWQTGRPFLGMSVSTLLSVKRPDQHHFSKRRGGKGHCVSTWPHFFDRAVTGLIDRRHCQRPLSIYWTQHSLFWDSVLLSRTITVHEGTYILPGVRFAGLSGYWSMMDTLTITADWGPVFQTSLPNERCMFAVCELYTGYIFVSRLCIAYPCFSEHCKI